MHTCRVGHVFIYHLRHPHGSVLGLKTQSLTDYSIQCLTGSRCIQLQRTPSKVTRINAPQNDIGIGHCRRLTPEPVTGRPRL